MNPTTISDAAPPSEREIQEILEDTRKTVRVMKASWLRVAMNLKRIRQHELWRHVQPACENYEDYVFGVLKLNRYVVKRMMQAMDYTEERRPELYESFSQRRDLEDADVDVPSYDTLNLLRRNEGRFEGREDEFRDFERRVYDEGVGRVTLKKELDAFFEGESAEGEGPEDSGEAVDASVADASPRLDSIIDRLKDIERQLLQMEVSKEARKLLFRLVETLEKET